MKKIKIISQASATRCEICHQADMFAPHDNYCKRCADIAVPVDFRPRTENVATLFKGTRPDSFFGFLGNVVVWQMSRLLNSSMWKPIHSCALYWLQNCWDVRITYTIFTAFFTVFMLARDRSPVGLWKAVCTMIVIDIVLTASSMIVKNMEKRRTAIAHQ